MAWPDKPNGLGPERVVTQRRHECLNEDKKAAKCHESVQSVSSYRMGGAGHMNHFRYRERVNAERKKEKKETKKETKKAYLMGCI